MGRDRTESQRAAQGWRDEAPDLTTGEHDLVAAVLHQAMVDVAANENDYPDGEKRSEIRAYRISAWRWIFEEDVGSRLTFYDCCLAVDLDPIAVREQIAKKVDPPETLHIPWRWDKFLSSTGDREARYCRRKRIKKSILVENLNLFSDLS